MSLLGHIGCETCLQCKGTCDPDYQMHDFSSEIFSECLLLVCQSLVQTADTMMVKQSPGPYEACGRVKMTENNLIITHPFIFGN